VQLIVLWSNEFVKWGWWWS